MSCPSNPLNVLRQKVEDLGPTLYARASWKDTWLNLIPREEYPIGAGVARSAFTIQRSEPTNDEEQWAVLTSISATQSADPCCKAYNPVTVGYLERVYGPSMYNLAGPLVCQDELMLHWNSVQFWEMYYQALEKRNLKTLHNRLANVYMNYTPKAGCAAGFAFGDPMEFHTVLPQQNGAVIAPSGVELDTITTPTSELTQEFLDITAQYLNEDGATDPNSNGWITLGPDGPVYPIQIGQEISARILLNNAEFRSDLRYGYDTFADAAPLLKRRGASLVIKNFRHVITLFPPRWDFVTEGTDGSAIGPAHLYTEPSSGVIYGYVEDATQAAVPWFQQVHNGGCWVRRPVFDMTNSSDFVTKGYSAEINDDWRDAEFEGAVVLTPWVFHEEILRPVNAAGNMRWTPKNYMGEWQFITGTDAVNIAAGSATFYTDPLKKYGRHFAEYKHAEKPIFPQYGRLIVFKRCQTIPELVTCS